MNLYSSTGQAMYVLSTIGAFLTGSVPFALLAGAAAFGAPPTVWIVTYYSSAILWTLCYLVPLLLIARRTKFVPGLAILGSSAAVLYSGFAVYSARTDHNPLYVGGLAAPIWFWLTLPLLFNIFQVALSALRYRQLCTSR